MSKQVKTIKEDAWAIYSELSGGIMKEMNGEVEGARKYLENNLYSWKMPIESKELQVSLLKD